MKTIAMYLPQFHRTKENDEWWGEGFTDWVSAKNAKPLFEGHHQPNEPLNDNYYDLLDKNTMVWQAKLAKEYGIDAFCFYHYWFKDGKKVLEKPAENLLKWKDIDIDFCFSWDSTPWTRTWSRINVVSEWVSTENSIKEVIGENGVLLEQRYGREAEWKSHFEYLLPFFQDKRYVKKDGMPIFVFYSSQMIYCLEDMVEYWNKLAQDEGFPGVYTIVTNSDERNWGNINASMVQEPGKISWGMVSNKLFNVNGNAKLIEYSKVYDEILALHHNEDRTVYYAGIVDFDNSPRKTPALIMSNTTPDLYKTYLKELLQKNHSRGNELQFINAWNEWGEGMYLEPDKKHEYAYLKATKEAIDLFNKEDKVFKSSTQLDENMEEKESKMHEYFDLMNQWMFLLEDKKNISDYFNENNFKRIAIYGYGHFAKHIIFQLESSNIKIDYVIEQNKLPNAIPLKTKTLKEELPNVDAIIVTPFMEYKNIKDILKEKVNCPIISIKEVIMEL